MELLVAAAHQVTSDEGLEEGDDLRQALITHVLKLTEDTSLEEDLGVSETVVVSEVEGAQDLLGGDLAVNEASLGDGVGSQDGVSGSGRKIEKFELLINT